MGRAVDHAVVMIALPVTGGPADDTSKEDSALTYHTFPSVSLVVLVPKLELIWQPVTAENPDRAQAAVCDLIPFTGNGAGRAPTVDVAPQVRRDPPGRPGGAGFAGRPTGAVR